MAEHSAIEKAEAALARIARGEDGAMHIAQDYFLEQAYEDLKREEPELFPAPTAGG